MDLIEIMKNEMRLRGYSHRTVISYMYWVRKFISKNHKDLRKFSKKDVREFLESYLDKKASGATINIIHAALRFLMIEVLKKGMRLNLRYSKAKKRIPRFLTIEEIKSIVSVIQNPKHRLLVQIMYGAGLRVSEAVNLKREDLELSEEYGWVRNGKGGKDRPFIVPKSILEDLKNSWGYLFPGRNGPMSTRSAQEILKTAALKAGIKKRVHPHMLRHSFATHLIQQGRDAMTVQALLGHADVRTTMTYLHAARKKIIDVESPLDSA